MILLYRVLTTFLYPILILAIFFRKIRKKEDTLRYKEKIFPSCFNVVRNNNSKLIWFHAASIGEFKSILPIIEEINNNHKNVEFLITTVTLSSSNLAKEELKKFSNVQHRFFPLDVEFLMNKFLSLWKPNIIFLVDSEIWPNLIFKANKNKIPLSLINARITSKTFNRWKIFPRTAKKVFSSFNLCLTSNLETKNYLLKFNKENIYFNGNIKLINKIDAGGIKDLNEKFLLKNRFWLAASTHKGEEVFCFQTHIKLKKKYKDIITIIAPRHIERVKSIKRSCDDFNLNVQILNKNEPILDNIEIIIINSFGILSNYFKYAKSVFIGKSTIKSLENVGGQNPIDAAKLGCKIYHGPYVYNFKEVYEILEKNYISKKIENAEELSDNLIKDLEDHRKENKKISVLINNLGQKTLADTMNKINNFLLNEIK
jgi:3-deoxy-D-manno-octulosonic-acid transferase|tara:strand:+ start:435 stop:1718 length:1284 start_codon:yes stop_codon:yes gene_type:complete